MRKTILHLVFVLMVAALNPVFAAASPSDDIASAGAQFIDLLAKGDFAGATARFDNTMKTALPEAKLRDTWQNLQQQAGLFKERVHARVEAQAFFQVALVTCKFERAELDAKVVFDGKRQVSGLWFVPSQAPTRSFKPPPYARSNAFHEKDFTVGSGEWRLPGTLTLPSGATNAVPALVLVHGSGPNDRDETIGANKPFRDLAWGLATRGIAVLRYEKRTKEHAAKLAAADFSKFTIKQETIDDALSAAAQLRTTDGVDPQRIFILGHSLGGIAAPRIAQADPNLAGLIILAGCLARPLEDIMVDQVRYLASLDGEGSEAQQAKIRDIEAQAAKVKELTAADAASAAPLLGGPPAYWLDLREYNPLAAAKNVKQPLLILQGGRDYHTPEADFQLWKQALGSQPNVTFRLYPNLNHLFVPGEGKSTPAEYTQPGHVAQAVVADIADWILRTPSDR